MDEIATSELSLEEVINHIAGGVLCCKNDAALTIAYANEPFYNMIGYEEGEITALLGQTPNDVLDNDPPINRYELIASLKQSDFVTHELKLIKNDGHHIWTNCHIRLMTAEDGTEYFCGLIADITQKRRSLKKEQEQLQAIEQAEKELAISEERYRIIMEQAADPICDYNFKTQELYCTHPFIERFGWDVGMDGLLDTLYHSDAVFEEDRSRIMRDIYGFIDGNSPKNPEYRIKNVDNNYYWYRVRCTVIRDEKGAPLRMIAFITDIDKQKKENIALKEKAERDLLTGLYNRMTTTALIDKAIRQSGGNSCHALCIIDIDNFKNVNDHFGHLAGDEMIVDVASKIESLFRGDDIMGRIGGDEFVVFLRDISPHDVQKRIHMLKNLFNSIHPREHKDYKLTGSTGIAIYPRDGESYQELFVKADTAMYAAKNSGKNACRIYSKELDNLV